MDVLPRLASLIPTGDTNIPTPDAPEATALREAYAAAIARGKDLGDFTDWSVKTGGSDVKFHTEAIGKKWPALVLDTITFTDPAPKAIVSERQEAWKGISNLGEFQAFIDAVVKEEDAFLKARALMPAISTRPLVFETSDARLWFARCSMAFVTPDSALRTEPTRRV